MNLSRYLVHPSVMDDARQRARQLSFVRGHLGGALVTALLVLIVIGRMEEIPPLLWWAAAWLIASPLGVALLPRLTGSLETAQAASIVNLSLLAFVLSMLTGGLASPLVPWFVLVPFEAALSGRRRLIFASVGLSIVSLGTLAFLQMQGFAPVFSLSDETAAPLLQGAGLVAAVIYAGLAASASQAAHRALTKIARDDEERYRVLAEYAMDLIMRFGNDGRITFASPAAFDILGKPPHDLIGRTISEFVFGGHRSQVQSALARTSYFGSEVALEFRVRAADGQMIWVEMRCRPLLTDQEADPGSAIIRWSDDGVGEGPPKSPAAAFETVAIIRDITERKRAEKALMLARDEAEAANRAKSRFLANMSHELRTPLNAIIGFSEMMIAELFGTLGDPRYAEYATHIKESGEHLRDVINDVLDMSKIEAGRFDLDLESVSVPRLLEDALKTVSVTAKKKNVELGVDLPSGLPHLRADRRAVKQMMLNILANAIKFTPEGGLVTAAARLEGPFMILAVTDTGIGIPEEALSQLGNPFEQVAKALRGDDDAIAGEPGTGLGLALVKAFAGLHGGSLEIASTMGEGTTVCIRLPLAGPERGQDAPLASPSESTRRVA